MNTREGGMQPHASPEAEKHRQLQAQTAETEVRGLLADARKSAEAGELGKAQVQHMLAFAAFEEHQRKGSLSPQLTKELDAELHRLFGLIELEEAA